MSSVVASDPEASEDRSSVKRQKLESSTDASAPVVVPTERVKAIVPEGMSKNQWKKLQRQKRWEESKEQYREIKRVKRRAAKVRQREAQKNGEAADEEGSGGHYHSVKKKSIPETQIPSGVHVIMDCEFDELMNNKEIVSMSNQVTRSYSAKRHCDYDVPLTISSFNKNLKQRFDKALSQYVHWQGMELSENEKLEDLLPPAGESRDKYVYLTADTDEVIETLEPGYTYIIGGIVDKNRHKNLCVNKAKELGLKVGKLPIDKYIAMNGRQVLATSHVYELMCKWFEVGGDWKKAFDEVLPARKVKKEGEEEDQESKAGEEDDAAEEGEEAAETEGSVEESAEASVAGSSAS